MEKNFKLETENIVKDQLITKYYFWNTKVGKIYKGSGNIEWDLIRDNLLAHMEVTNPFIYKDTLTSDDVYKSITPTMVWVGYMYLESGKAYRRVAEVSAPDMTKSIETWTEWVDTRYDGEPEAHFTIEDGGKA